MSGGFIIGNNSNVKYENFRQSIKTTISGVNVFNTLLNITGSGYLDFVALYNNSGSTNATLQVTIDDEIVFNGKFSASCEYGYFGKENILTGSNGSYTVIFLIISTDGALKAGVNTDAMASTYPYTVGDQKSMILPKEIYFNKNLKIEIKSDVNGTNIWSEIEGGIL